VRISALNTRPTGIYLTAMLPLPGIGNLSLITVIVCIAPRTF